MVRGVVGNIPVLQLPCQVRMQNCDKAVKPQIAQLTLRHIIAPKDNQVKTLCTPWTTLSVTAVRNLRTVVEGQVTPLTWLDCMIIKPTKFN